MSIKELVQQDRKAAQELRQTGQYKESATRSLAAIKRLEDELFFARLDEKYGASACEILELLSQTHGSLAGNWRDAGRTDRAAYQEAITHYDLGNEYERERRSHCGLGGLDTYNLVQRLIVRLLEKPARLESSEPCVDGKSMAVALEEVRVEIDRQIEAGRQDSWVLADRALVRFLIGLPEDLQPLDEGEADKSFYSTSAKVVRDLLNEGLGRDTNLAERLGEFEALLLRKGGLARR